MTKSRYAYSIICVHENPEKKEYSQYTAAVTFSKASAFTIVLYNKTDIHEDLYETCYILKNSPGIIVEDDIQDLKYAYPTNVCGNNNVFVSRIRRDFSIKNGLNLWVVADNIRKGAATNAVQILKELI